MKLYLGSRDYKPEGFKTVDIDPLMNPDFVADITNMDIISKNSCSQVVASHVLEHLDWPDSFLAFAEFSRILQINGKLQIAVPDLGFLLRMMHSGDSMFHVVGLVYGVGGRINKFEQHRYGFSLTMLIDILETLGFSQFNWWNSSVNDASNGWVPRYDSDHYGISLNIEAIKAHEPELNYEALYDDLVSSPLSDFSVLAARHIHINNELTDNPPSKVYQRIHFQLIEARERIKYLENELNNTKMSIAEVQIVDSPRGKGNRFKRLFHKLKAIKIS
jgi:predicted SAM-dependent methyltransferase